MLKLEAKKLLITNLLGSVYVKPEVKNGFIKLKELLTTTKHDYSFIDIHAEATSEKVALGHYLDGLASLVVGTHTHVQTNDLRILPKGTIYLTDVGMTGPLNGVIGVENDIVINRFINVSNIPNKVAEGRRQLNGLFVNLSTKECKLIHLEYE